MLISPAQNEESDSVVSELSREGKISIISLIDALLTTAYERGVSDIHIVPEQEHTRIRLRIDGILHNAYHVPRHLHSEIISRIKVLSRLRTDEHQATQDGRFRHILPSKKAGEKNTVEENKFTDIRVSIVPAYHGETIVLRLLSDHANIFTLDSLGFSKPDREKVRRALTRPSGMILSTGPTGSGKTTTLYTLGTKFVRTFADSTWTDNLLKLPEC